MKQIANELCLIINKEVRDKNDKIIFVSQGNLGYIYSKLIGNVISNVSSLDPTNFMFNKKIIDECVDSEILKKSTKYIDEHIDVVMDLSAEMLDYGIDNIPKYTSKQIKTIYLCSDKKELVDKLQHIDIKKIV